MHLRSLIVCSFTVLVGFSCDTEDFVNGEGDAPRVDKGLHRLYEDGNLVIYNSSGLQIPVSEDGVLEASFYREPVTDLFLAKYENGTMTQIGKVQLLHRWSEVDSIAGYGPPAQDTDASTSASVNSAKGPLEDAWDWWNNAGETLGEAVDEAIQEGADAFEDAVGQGQTLWDDANQSAEEWLSDALSGLSFDSMLIGYITSKPPLVWTQRNPPGVGAFKSYHGLEAELMRNVVKIRTQVEVIKLILLSHDYYNIRQSIIDAGLEGGTFADWDREVLAKALDLAGDISDRYKSTMVGPVVLANYCLELGNPTWLYPTQESTAAPSLAISNYCANTFFISAKLQLDPSISLLEGGERPIHRIAPSVSLTELGGLFWTAANAALGHDWDVTENGILNFLNLLPSVFSAGAVRGIWGQTTESPLASSSMDAIESSGSNIVVKWDNGFMTSNSLVSTIYVPRDVVQLVPVHLFLGLSPVGIFTTSMILSSIYDLSALNDSESYSPFDIPTNQEFAERMEYYIENREARLALNTNQILIFADFISLSIDVGKIILDVGAAPTDGATTVVSLVLEIMRGLITSSEFVSSYVETADSVLWRVPLLMAEQLYFACVLRTGDLDLCEEVRLEANEQAIMYANENNDNTTAFYDAIDAMIEQKYSVADFITNDLLTSAITELEQNTEIEEICLDVCTSDYTEEEAAAAADLIGGNMDKLKFVGTFLDALDFLGILSDVEVIASECFSAISMQSRGEFIIGLEQCQSAGE